MHIRITHLDTPVDDALAVIDGCPGLACAYALRVMDSQESVLVSAWDDDPPKDDAGSDSAGLTYDRGRLHAGVDADEPAQYGQLFFFDGPRPPAQAEAIDRAGSERIWPAVRDVPGTVAALVGRGSDGSSVVVCLTTSLQALEDAQRATLSTELLPGEEPALLTGPDRIQLASVLAQSSQRPPISSRSVHP